MRSEAHQIRQNLRLAQWRGAAGVQKGQPSEAAKLFEERQRLRMECDAVTEQIQAAERDIARARGDLADHAGELSFARGEHSDTQSTYTAVCSAPAPVA